MPPTTILTVNDLGMTFGSEAIFGGVGFQLAEREHVALVGANGAGKSTILRIIAGAERPSAGSIAQAGGLRTTYLPQEAQFNSDHTVREEARSAFAPVLAAARRMREIEHAMAEAGEAELETLLEEYERLQTRFEAAGGYDVEHRTDEVLMGLGFLPDQFDQPVNQLSGGQKTRVALVKALLADPDLLLLDEPTNHLDLEMLEWLESFLRGWIGACLIVSHDRYFLDRVTSRTLDLAFGRLEDYPAPYGRYLQLREERMGRRLLEWEEQQEFIARTEEFIRKYKAGQRSREARGRQTRLERLQRVERPQALQSLSLKMGSAARSGRGVLHLSPIQVGYGPGTTNGRTDRGTVLVVTPELEIERGDRVALIGPNGSGKTTLLRSITGQLPPLKGRIELGTNVKVGYYAQIHDQLNFDGTPLSIVLDAQAMSEEAARTYLGRFLFVEDDVFKRVASLSGGERSRLALAVLLLQQANFLVLDEPTNHLDINARETLEEMLAAFDGSILFVSHDRYFIDKIATRVWAIAEARIATYLGNYTDYQRALGHRPELKGSAGGAGTTETPVVAVGSPDGPHAPRLSEAKLQKGLNQSERDVARLEGKLNEVSDALAVASIDADVAAVQRLSIEYDRVQAELEAAYTAWEEWSDQLAAIATPAGSA